MSATPRSPTDGPEDASASPALPTLKDVAAHAGVSAMTVSRVVNGRGGVSEDVTRRVLDGIQALGYRRNELAASIRRGHTTALIGLVIQDMASPFFAAIARAVEEVARARGSMVVTTSSDDQPERERRVVEALLAHRIDGLLVFSADTDHAHLLRELRHGLPMVFLGRPPGGIDAPSVIADNVGGAQEATSHLLALGHRRIGLIADATAYTAEQRRWGFRRALGEAGVRPDPALERTGARTPAQARRAALDLLDLPEPPTALFATNNRMTLGLLEALRERDVHRHPATRESPGSGQLRPPAFIGFDDFEYAALTCPPTAVVTHDPADMGRAAAELIFAQREGNPLPPTPIVMPTTLVLRESGTRPGPYHRR